MSLIYSEYIGGKRHGLYLGGKSDAKDRDKLQQRGITHILNTTPPKEGSIKAGVPNYFENKFTYKRIAVYDASTSDLLQHADSIVGFISSGLCHGSVLVHCQRGVSRSVTCVAFYLMRKAGMNLEESMALIRQKRPTAEPIPAFVAQLQEYEQKCIALGVLSRQSKRKVEGTDESKIPAKKRAIGPVICPPKRAIGPSLPPFKRAGKVDGATGTSEKNAPSGGPRPRYSGVGTPEKNGDNIRMEHQRDRDEGKGTNESRSPIIGPIPAPPRTG